MSLSRWTMTVVPWLDNRCSNDWWPPGKRTTVNAQRKPDKDVSFLAGILYFTHYQPPIVYVVPQFSVPGYAVQCITFCY